MKNISIKKESIPDGLDLGSVTSAPVGALIAVLDTLKTVRPTVAPKLFVVDKDEGFRLRLRSEGGGKTVGAIVKERNGASPYFMLDKCFYYSANPVHIQLAKKKIIDAKRREEKIKEKRDAKMEIARPIGEILGDGDAFDSDGDAYQSSQIAQELAGRLTTRQLRLLSGWLAAKGN